MAGATATSVPQLPRFRDPQQALALLFGTVLIALGVLDLLGVFVTDDALFGIFEISYGFNVVHLLTGLLGFVLAFFPGAGALFNKLGGVIYLVVFLVGVIVLLAGSTLINWAMNLLHLALAIVVGAVGYGIGGHRPR